MEMRLGSSEVLVERKRHALKVFIPYINTGKHCHLPEKGIENNPKMYLKVSPYHITLGEPIDSKVPKQSCQGLEASMCPTLGPESTKFPPHPQQGAGIFSGTLP
jgi:hypothetical protein